MIILGIDPGTANIGYGIIEKTTAKSRGVLEDKQIKVIDYGCIKTDPKTPTGERLVEINDGIDKLIIKYKPNILAIENVYFFKNLKTALPVSQAKGVILLTAAKRKIPVYEFTPLQVKMTVAGYGKADKKQVQKMIATILNLKEAPKSDDAADALGAAICGSIALNNPLSCSCKK